MYTQATTSHLSESSRKQFKIQSIGITKDQLTIIIPVKNEELAIGQVIDELLEEGYSNILAVDGYSVDKTPQILHEKQEVSFIQQHGKGKTGAIKTAIENVSTPYLLILDGDYTYQAKDIQRLLNHCGNYAQVIGIRDQKNISLIHRFGNRIITKTFNLLMGTNLSDICSGMYLLKTDVAKNIELGSRNFATEVEIAAQTVAEYQVTEVPIGYRSRIGKAKLSWRNGFEILSSVVSLARKYNPILLFSAFSLLSIIPAVTILAWVGLPVIIHREVGARETIVDGVSGFAVGAEPKEWAECIHHLLTDKEFYNKVSRESRLRAKEFSWDAATENFESLIVKRFQSAVLAKEQAK